MSNLAKAAEKDLNVEKTTEKKQRNFSAGELKIIYNNENNLIFLFGGLLLQIKNSFSAFLVCR